MRPFRLRVSNKYYKYIYINIYINTLFLGLKCDEINTETGRSASYRIQGQLYHHIGSMNPVNVDKPNDLQVYFINDIIRETERRLDLISETSDNLLRVFDLLREHNRHVNTFTHCKEYMAAHTTDDYTLVYVDTSRPSGEHIGLNVPNCDEMEILLHMDVPFKRDIILRYLDDSLTSLSDLNPKYDSPQYPLLFPYGDDTFHIDIKVAVQTRPISTREYGENRYRIPIAKRSPISTVYFRCIY